MCITSCSGNDSKTTTPPEPDHYWGYLTPETKGIYYECGDLSGKTGPEGRFNYHKGEEVTFYLGDIELGTVIGGQIVTPFSLAGHDPVPADLDTALANDLADYPKARNIMHFLLAINELYDSGSSSYLYEDLMETFELMHLELDGKTLDFSDPAIDDFQAQLDNLSSKRISLGGLNLIDKTLITGHIQDLETKVENAQERPEFLYDYSDTDYASIPNPPVDGQVLTMEQLKGIWIVERGVYGDRSDNSNPDSAYRDQWVDFPQDNYLMRFDDGANEEDMICNRYTKYFSFSEDEYSWYVNIENSVEFRPEFNGIYLTDGGTETPWLGETAINAKNETDFTGMWKSNPLQFSRYARTYNGEEITHNMILSYTRTGTYGEIILPWPYENETEWDGTTVWKLQLDPPQNGIVTLYLIPPGGTEREKWADLKKINPEEVSGAETAFFPID